MGITNQEYFLLFVTSYLLVGVLTPLMRKIALATNVVDNPNAAHKSHKKAVPYLGGVAIIIGIISISYSTSLVSDFTSTTFCFFEFIVKLFPFGDFISAYSII